mmetsp:Transcript_1770/g.5014  ORF Transcript_1770/g.5014 Transcript_1770/m.5014 type:complete len:249 (+) Transcript_1770:883-1629(+)
MKTTPVPSTSSRADRSSVDDMQCRMAASDLTSFHQAQNSANRTSLWSWHMYRISPLSSALVHMRPMSEASSSASVSAPSPSVSSTSKTPCSCSLVIRWMFLLLLPTYSTMQSLSWLLACRVLSSLKAPMAAPRMMAPSGLAPTMISMSPGSPLDTAARKAALGCCTTEPVGIITTVVGFTEHLERIFPMYLEHSRVYASHPLLGARPGAGGAGEIPGKLCFFCNSSSSISHFQNRCDTSRPLTFWPSS